MREDPQGFEDARFSDPALCRRHNDLTGVAATLRAHVRRVRAADPGTLLTVVVAEEIGKLAGQYGAARIVIEGHTDASGDPACRKPGPASTNVAFR